MIRSILAIDDSATMRALLQATLADAGYDVHVAADGELALELAAAIAFDLVVTDHHMPGKNGLDVIRTLRARRLRGDADPGADHRERRGLQVGGARGGRHRLDREAARPGNVAGPGGGAGGAEPPVVARTRPAPDQGRRPQYDANRRYDVDPA